MIVETAKFMLRVYFLIFYKVKIYNKEKVPQTGAAILCSNHIGYDDMFFIGYKIKRIVRYMAKEELFKNPVAAFILKRCGAFPVKRGAGDIGAIRTALKLLKDDHIIGIYPEGTRTKNKKDITAKAGPILLAKKSGVPILPVKVERKPGRFGEVKVIFGDLYYIDFEKDKKYSNAELSKMSQEVLDKVYALSGDE